MLLTTSVLKQIEVPATVSSFYVSVLYTAMLRTSIAAVILGCSFYLFDIACLNEQSRNNDGHEGSSDGVLSDYPTVYCGIL